MTIRNTIEFVDVFGDKHAIAWTGHESLRDLKIGEYMRSEVVR